MEQKPDITFDTHDYDDFDTLDKDGWHWEFTRRNDDYKKAYDEMINLLENGDEHCQECHCSECNF